jgi:hypothetical protein
MKITKLYLLGFGRNLPKIIEALSADGSGGHQIEASTVDPSLGAVLYSSPFLAF